MATAQAVTVTGMDAVYYLAKDFKRARTFYESALGLRVSSEMQGEGGGEFVEYDLSDGSTFGLAYLPDTPWHESGGVMFAVPNVKQALERAKSAGASVYYDTMELPSCEMAWARDTEGNSFSVHHRK
jgi:predicted enzyme related to lactoylglutathione lyase